MHRSNVFAGDVAPQPASARAACLAELAPSPSKLAVFEMFGMFGASALVVVARALLRKGLAVAALLAAMTAITAAAPAELRGVVIDAASGEPIEGATVYAIGVEAEAVTDARGRFTLPRAGVTAVTVVDDLHQPSTVNVGSSAELRVRLAPMDHVDGASEVIAVFGQRPARAPGATTVARDEIVRLPGSRGDALTGIKNLPGIANNGSLTPDSGGLIIRGSSPEDSRILVDGFEIPILYHFLGVSSVIPTEMLEDIEVLPGAYGPEFGHASSGVVSLTSRRGARGAGGFLELSFVNGAMFIEGPLGKRGSFAVAARRSFIDAILPAVIPDEANLSFTAYPRYYDYQAQAELEVSDRWQLSAFLFGADDRVVLDNGNDNANDPVATGRFANTTSFVRGILSASYSGGPLTATLAASAFADANDFSVGTDRYLKIDRTGAAARAEVKATVGPALTLVGGAESDLVRYTYDLKVGRPPREGDPMLPNLSEDALLETSGEQDVPDLGAWMQAKAAPVRSVELEAGARVDAFLRNRDVVVQPRAQATWHASDTAQLRVAGGLYARPPQDQDENLQKDLQAERAWHVTLGGEKRLTSAMTVSATFFSNTLRDLVVLDGSRRDAEMASYVNRGEGSALGAELLLRYRGPALFGWLAYTAARATRRDAPDAATRLFDYDQAHNLVAVASWRLGGGWQLGARFQLTTGKPITPVVGSVYQSDRDSYLPVFGEVNSRRVDAQHQLDLRIDKTWDFRSWKLTGYLDVSNTYLNAAVIDYAYNYDYSSRQAITTLPILPSIGLRGEL